MEAALEAALDPPLTSICVASGMAVLRGRGTGRRGTGLGGGSVVRFLIVSLTQLSRLSRSLLLVLELFDMALPLMPLLLLPLLGMVAALAMLSDDVAVVAMLLWCRLSSNFSASSSDLACMWLTSNG